MKYPVSFPLRIFCKTSVTGALEASLEIEDKKESQLQGNL